MAVEEMEEEVRHLVQAAERPAVAVEVVEQAPQETTALREVRVL
jgi:hypothetical protein